MKFKKDIKIKKSRLSKKIKNLLKNSFNNTPFAHIKWFYRNLEKNKGDIYCLYLKKEPLGIIQLLNKKESLEIETIAVKKEYQRKGFGTILVSFAVAEAKKRKKKFLEATTLKDYSVEKFYIKNLFKKISEKISIKFKKRDFLKLSKFADEISEKNSIALIKKNYLKKIKNLDNIKILREYQTFQRDIF